jgi:hypothetical protein
MQMEIDVNLVNQITELEAENKSLKENHTENVVGVEKELARIREE